MHRPDRATIYAIHNGHRTQSWLRTPVQQPVRTGGRCSSGGHILDDSCDIYYQSDPTRAYDEYSRISRWNGARAAACVPPHCWCMHGRAGRPCIERRAVAFGGGFRTTATPRPRGAAGAAPAPALSRALRSRVYYWRQHACTAVVRTPMRAPTHPAAGSLDRPSLPAAASLLPRLATPSS